MATYYDMPEDVIFNILLWLPVVSLLRFKSVCKSWCSLIGSSGFITQHLHLASKHNDKIIRFDPEQSVNHSCTSFSFSLLSGDKFDMCDQIFDLPVPYDRNGGLADIIDTCNGIICLYLPDDIIILWNPAIRQYKRLPQSLQSLWNPAIEQYKFLPENENYVDIHYGFGFDAENNHYKVVRLFIRDSIDLPKCRAEVYNLSNDTWRSIDAAFYCKDLYSDSKVLYRNGIYCCVGMLGKDNVTSDSILTFDFTSEVVGALSLPDEFSCQRCLLDLSILRGNIACIHRNVRSSEMHDWHFKIWVLTEYGVKESWTMLYTIRLTYQAWALSRKFSSSGKLFMFLEDKKCLCKPAECVCNNQLKMALCDCRTHEVSFLPIQLCKCLHQNLQVVVYNESLVSIKNANGEASRASCETPTLKIPAVNSSEENKVKALKKKDITAEVAVQEAQYPVTEKLLQQSCRLVEEADYKFTTELSAKTYNKKSLDNFVPRSESNFLEYAELISHKLVSFENSAHYIGLLKNIMKLSMRNLKAADVKELASLVTTIANEKGVEAIAGKSKSV